MKQLILVVDFCGMAPIRREPVAVGVLMSYGPHFSEMMRRAASLVDKILSGTPPADLPIEQPTTF
jgi:putative ABC transport system substrate-binding protein